MVYACCLYCLKVWDCSLKSKSSRPAWRMELGSTMKQEKRGEERGVWAREEGRESNVEIDFVPVYKGLQSRKKQTNTSKLNMLGPTYPQSQSPEE